MREERRPGPGNGSFDDVLEHVARCAEAECSFCRDGCPAYVAHGLESRSPRGKNRVLGARLTDDAGDLAWLETVAYECTMCGYCAEVCISGGDVYTIVPDLREMIASGRGAPAELARSAGDALRDGTPYDLKETSWASGLPGKGRVGYFPGCSILAKEPDVAARTVKVLEGLGIRPVPVTDLCCGSPAFNAGLMKGFGENAERLVAEMKGMGIRKLILSCPGCLNMMVNHFPRSGMEFVHVSEVIASSGIEGPRGMKVIFHDPCNLGRKSGVVDAPRRVLASMGCELIEFEDSGAESACCGGGGGFATLHPDASMVPARARVDEAVRSGAGAIVTCCRTCRDQLANASDGRIPVMLLLDLVDGFAEAGGEGKLRKGSRRGGVPR